MDEYDREVQEELLDSQHRLEDTDKPEYVVCDVPHGRVRFIRAGSRVGSQVSHISSSDSEVASDDHWAGS